MTKDKYKQAFLKMAEVFAETSTATRLKVGCVVVKNATIIALGVNGQPPGWSTEVCEDENNCTLPTVRHAEDAALQKLWGTHETSTGAELYVTHSPCLHCAIKISTAKISKVYYRKHYRDSSGAEYLQKQGVHVEQLGE